MTGIVDSDIQFFASQVMSDVPEGGAGPTGNVITDGLSNNAFDDISEIAHVEGQVSLRKLFLGVQNDGTAKYLGANVIIEKPPVNTDVSAVLFNTADEFDTRAEATARIEAYLARGATYNGQLFSDHIAGQQQVALQQKIGTPLPANGDTLVLTQFGSDGNTASYTEYIRIVDVASQTRTFTVATSSGDQEVQKLIVTVTISAPLEHDYNGFDPIYYETGLDYANKARVYETTIANAAVYYGTVALLEDASVNDFGVQGTSIFAQLVPSSRTEIAITDARMNQQLSAALGTGVAATGSATLLFDSAHPLFVGGGMVPGSFSASVGTATITDKGGNLLNSSGSIIGAMDYANGIATLATDVFGASAVALTWAYTRAAPATVEGESIGVDVTEPTRRMTYAISLEPVPARGTLQVSYLSGGKWYTLTEDGSGAIRGTDSAFGVGTLNFLTGTVSLTLGALPDAPSSIIFQWAPTVTAPGASLDPVASPGTGYLTLPLGHPASPGTIVVTWPGGKTADDSSGVIAGDATGSVDYETGRVFLSPTVLPAPGTVFHVAGTQQAHQTDTILSYTDSGSHWSFSLAHTPVTPKTIHLATYESMPWREFPGADQATQFNVIVFDDGAGVLRVPGFDPATGDYIYDNVGTINYTTGACTLTKSVTVHSRQPIYETVYPLGDGGDHYVRQSGYEVRTITATMQNGGDEVGESTAGLCSYAQASGSGTSADVTADTFTLGTVLEQNRTLADGATFTLGTDRYLAATGGALLRNVNPSTGEGTAAGTWASSTGQFLVTLWATGVGPAVTNFSGVLLSPTGSTDGVTTPVLADGVTFRTASSPIAPEGFQVLGTVNGSPFNVTADDAGKIVGSSVFGTIDYNTGVVRLRFGSTTTDAVGPTVVDLTSWSIPGVAHVSLLGAELASLRYNAVAFDYLPIDPDILGLNPVRLPSDGRVPIFKKGSYVVVHKTVTKAPATYANGDTITLGETRVSHVQLVGNDNSQIETGFDADLDAGTIHVSSISGWAQPVTIYTRVEDAALATDAQINGAIALSRKLTHDYPADTSYVSSAILFGDLYARISILFSQGTWTTEWEDIPIGGPILAQYNDIDHPIVVTDTSALTERWALIFQGNTNFEIVGEHLGVIGVGTTSTDCAPINANTGEPYFFMAKEGFGSAWSAGNVIRMNTVGANRPVWVARVVQQGTNTVDSDSFTILARGDVDA